MTIQREYNPKPAYLSSSAFARHVGVSRAAVCDAVKRGALEPSAWVLADVPADACADVVRHPLFTSADVDAWIARDAARATMEAPTADPKWPVSVPGCPGCLRHQDNWTALRREVAAGFGATTDSETVLIGLGGYIANLRKLAGVV